MTACFHLVAEVGLNRGTAMQLVVVEPRLDVLYERDTLSVQLIVAATTPHRPQSLWPQS